MQTPAASTCPYIGLKDDEQTFMNYPSTGNSCFKCQPAAVPLMMHQETYCLTESYRLCPVYSQNGKHPLPRHLRVEQAGEMFIGIKIATVVVSILALVLLAWQLFQYFLATPQIAPTPEMIIATLEPATATLTIIPTTPTLAIAAVQTPTSTPQPEQIHQLEYPIVVGDHTFLIHMTMEGEVIETLERNYDTTFEVIRDINFNFPSMIWANAPVVIAPGMKTIDPSLPSFRAYQVTSAEIHIDDLADLLKVDRELLKKFNNCIQGCILKKDEWIIVPRGE